MPTIGDTVMYTKAFLRSINAQAYAELYDIQGVITEIGKTYGKMHLVKVRWTNAPDREVSVDINVLLTVKESSNAIVSRALRVS